MRGIGTFSFLILISIVFWEALHISAPLLFPEPAMALKTLVTRTDVIFSHYPYTILVVIFGLILSLVLGFVFASLFQILPYLDTSFFPWLIVFQSIPVTVGPLILGVFGYSLVAKVFVVALLGFFPVFLILNNAMRNASRDSIKAFQAMGFSPLEIFFFVRIPSTLPYVFIGMRGSLCWVFSATILTELLGTDRGLGFLIENSVLNLDTSMVFAVLIIISISSFLLYLLLIFLQKKCVPWYRGGSKMYG